MDLPALLQLTAQALGDALGGFTEAFFGRPVPDDATSAVEYAIHQLDQFLAANPHLQTPAPPPGQRRP